MELWRDNGSGEGGGEEGVGVGGGGGEGGECSGKFYRQTHSSHFTYYFIWHFHTGVSRIFPSFCSAISFCTLPSFCTPLSTIIKQQFKVEGARMDFKSILKHTDKPHNGRLAEVAEQEATYHKNLHMRFHNYKPMFDNKDAKRSMGVEHQSFPTKLWLLAKDIRFSHEAER
jgi:hypothetical protein